ncbi:MAG: NADH-quinone oxidoreductase subunit D [Chlamydiia bacterium]|nr:NADH-quinone oxidoreductase subunit D [Chlamydiia bacterium]
MFKQEIENRNLEKDSELMELSLGPQHPSTHGVLRIKLVLRGEIVEKAEPVIGYLHTGVEKECETRTYHQVLTLVDRLDYLSGPAEEQAYIATVEKLMDVEVPERAQTLRLILLELARISSHLLWLGTSALELNMSSIYMYCFAEREKILDIFELISGARMFPGYWRVGGVAQDIPDGFEAAIKIFLKKFLRTYKDLDNLLTKNYIWCERTKGIGTITVEDCRQYMLTGPILRACGEAYDIRKIYPYLQYDKYQFDVPTQKEGDSYARYLVRMEEFKQSAALLEQALKKLKPGAFITDNRKVALPTRSELRRSMEAVIHQFKLVSEGFHPPAGELYTCVESARGELGYFLVSDASNKPYRLHVRAPSFAHVQILGKILVGQPISDMVVTIASVDPILGDVDR